MDLHRPSRRQGRNRAWSFTQLQKLTNELINSRLRGLVYISEDIYPPLAIGPSSVRPLFGSRQIDYDLGPVFPILLAPSCVDRSSRARFDTAASGARPFGMGPICLSE